MCADLHRQMQYIANRLDGLLADVRDVPWDENFKPLINEVFISHHNGNLALIIHLIIDY